MCMYMDVNTTTHTNTHTDTHTDLLHNYTPNGMHTCYKRKVEPAKDFHRFFLILSDLI